ncbi:MAG TPA: aspartate-semialdehyde dehydrogenase [Candidatus Kapabacteria bacterium]|nr:aspartate-semialdehyde dehydrogenase [Candidatus Kapabacteria bacterium]
MSKNIAIVGATGLVGRTFIRVLAERNFPVKNIRLFASERSAGSFIDFNNEKIIVEKLEQNCFKGTDIALFSAGGAVAKEWAKVAASSNCIAIDNSSYWRMFPDVPLVVPEVNPKAIKEHNGIIANPNCSTIQLVVALKPISDNFQLKRVLVSTYQSISGAGQSGLNQLNAEINGTEVNNPISKHRISNNCTFHSFESSSNFTVEENKMINETRKILNLKELPVSVTCARIPVIGGHCESVNLELENDFTIEQIKEVLSKQQNLIIKDNPELDEYPTLQDSENSDLVFVGRLRRDLSIKNGLHLWIVANNVRKGAATNAIQIAELL